MTTFHLSDYLKDKVMILLAQLTGMLLLTLFLFLTDYPRANIFLIVFVWAAALLLFLGVDFYSRSRYFSRLFGLLHLLDQRYLIAEVMEEPRRLEDRLCREVLRQSNKAVIERIRQLEDSQREYREYIESWIHEVKTPLTAMELICENRPGETADRIRPEILRLESQVEQVLYYVRMDKAYQDYLIRPVDLRETVCAAVKKNRLYFIENGMQVKLDLPPVTVSTDEKWVLFLLDQIFSNCIKYHGEKEPTVRLYTERGVKNLSLVIEDNGPGIAPEDIGRVFDKGFTGKNGRTGKNSTGLGLYLCKQLCEKLGLGITCESPEGAGTKIILTFPDSDHNKI